MRKSYLDNIRWVTVMLVVIYHVLYIFNNVGVLGRVGPLDSVQYQDVILYLLYPWFMLLLFVVAGMSARFSLNHQSHRDFLRAKTVKLLVPSTLGVLVLGWIEGYFNIKISGAFAQMPPIPGPILYLIMALSGIGPLWFIQMLWLFSVLLVLFRKIEHDKLWNLCGKATLPILLGLIILIWGSAQILNTPLIAVYRFGIYGMGYLLGYLVLSHDEVTDRLKKAWLPLTAAAITLGIAFTAVFWGQSYADQSVLDTLLCNAFAWVTVLAVLSFMKKWADRSTPFSDWMKKESWGLYLFHYPPLLVSASYIYAVPLPVVVKYLFVTAAAFGGGLLLSNILRRIPVLRWCVCGISKKKTIK